MKRDLFTQIVLSSLLLTTTASADTATYTAGGYLTLPSVKVGENAFSVGLNLATGRTPVTFTLTSVYGEVKTNEPGAIYFDGLLTINQGAVGNGLYSATMELVPDSNPAAFQLTDAIELCQNCATATRAEGGITLLSSGFPNGDSIPSVYTCMGADVSVPLTWTPGPSDTQAYAIIMDDPDARSVAGFTFVHWNLFNVPAGNTTLPEGAADGSLPAGATHGFNDFGWTEYDGPCPPRGHGTHNYRIRIYALDSAIAIPGSPLTLEEFETSYQSHILDTSNILTGTFSQ